MPFRLESTDKALAFYNSGISAYQTSSYNEAINYLKQAKKNGLSRLQEAKADRIIGMAYLKIKRIDTAEKYLRKSTITGLFFNNSIASLFLAENSRSPLYKWIKGEDHEEKLDEILDWYLASGAPDSKAFDMVANYAFEHKKWHKAVYFLELLNVLDKSNDFNKTRLIVAYHSIGDFARTNYLLKEYSQTKPLTGGLLAFKAEMDLIFGNFVGAKESIASLAASKKKNYTEDMNRISTYIRASELSTNFQTNSKAFFLKSFLMSAYIDSIDNMENFSMTLNSLSTYFDYFHNSQVVRINALRESVKNQLLKTVESFPKLPEPADKATTPGKKHPVKLFTYFEIMENRLKKERDDIDELIRVSPILNTITNVEFVNKYEKASKKARSSLKLRVLVFQILLSVFKFVLFLLLAIILIDGIMGAISDKNLLSLIFPYLTTTNIPSWLNILIALSWFFALFFIDEVLVKKINKKFVDVSRKALKDFVNVVPIHLSNQQALGVLLEASQPLPNMNMPKKVLLEYGCDGTRIWETRLAALEFAEIDISPDDICPYKDQLIKLLDSEQISLSYAAARLLCILKVPEVLTAVEISIEQGNDHEFHVGLNALAKNGTEDAFKIISKFIIKNIQEPIRLLAALEILKQSSSQEAINALSSVIEHCLDKQINPRNFLAATAGKGDAAVYALFDLINRMHQKITNNFDWTLAILNTGSQVGYQQVKKWFSQIDESNPLENLNLELSFDSLIIDYKLDFIMDIATDNNVDIRIRKVALSKLAIFEKENIQELAFTIWGSQQFSEDFIKILGDIGSPTCVDTLLELYQKNKAIEESIIINPAYPYIFSSLGHQSQVKGFAKLSRIDIGTNFG